MGKALNDTALVFRKRKQRDDQTRINQLHSSRQGVVDGCRFSRRRRTTEKALNDTLLGVSEAEATGRSSVSTTIQGIVSTRPE